MNTDLLRDIQINEPSGWKKNKKNKKKYKKKPKKKQQQKTAINSFKMDKINENVDIRIRYIMF
jgi:hypothetical protein